MKYTVIIPVYNGAATLYECLNAITHQEGMQLNEDYSVIVVDDGSTDNSVEIARQFPITVIELGHNQGRIIARLTGANAAKTEKILFVDSRVIVATDILKNGAQFSQHPAVMGSYNARTSKYNTVFDTVFFLIRKQFYGSKNFPQQEELLFIDANNFTRAPKGTTVLLIDRALFIELTPERTDKTVNDDTLLFQNLVYSKKLPLIRATPLKFVYKQRTDMKSFIPWLYERGIRFADFYLRPGGYFYKPFCIILIALLILSPLLIWSFFSSPILLFAAVAALLLIFICINIYIAENIRDFFTCTFLFPLILAIFSSGIAQHLFTKGIRKD